MNASGSVEGVFVSPWPVNATVPVGFAAVPPHVHVVAACADAAPVPRAASEAAATAAVAMIARGLIRLLSLRRERRISSIRTLRRWWCSATPAGPINGLTVVVTYINVN